jgi:BTB/POZ domain
MEPTSSSSSSLVSTGSISNETEKITIVSSSAASRGMLAVFDEQHLSDATVACGTGQQQRTIYISRAIVTAGSPYFERLFAFNAAACNDHKHGQSAVSEVISWPDHKPEIACAVLQYLYSDTCSFDRSYTDEVLNLAAQVFLNNFKFEALLTQILKASIVRWGCASIPSDEKVSMLHRLYLHESLLSADSFLVHSTEQQLGGRSGIWAQLTQASRAPAQLLDISECLMHKLLSWDRHSADFDAVSEQDVVLTTLAWCCARAQQQQQQPAALQSAFSQLIELGKLELEQLEPAAVERFVVPAGVLTAEQLLALYKKLRHSAATLGGALSKWAVS